MSANIPPSMVTPECPILEQPSGIMCEKCTIKSGENQACVLDFCPPPEKRIIPACPTCRKNIKVVDLTYALEPDGQPIPSHHKHYCYGCGKSFP